MTDEKDDKWEMPKPVFRSSTGELPKSLQKTISGYNMPKGRATTPEDDDAEDDILSVLAHPVVNAAQPQIEKEEILETGGETAIPVSDKTGSTDQPEVQPSAEPKTAPIKITAAKPKPPKRAGVGSFILIFLLIAALAVGLVWTLMYFLANRALNNGTF